MAKVGRKYDGKMGGKTVVTKEEQNGGKLGEENGGKMGGESGGKLQ